MLPPALGRMLSAAGAAVVVVALFLTWYHVERSPALGDPNTTGWQTFPNLRIIILVGAVAVFASALVVQSRGVLIARTVIALVLAALILRRIIDPPDLRFPVTNQAGVIVGFVAALAMALGGLVDSGRAVARRYPDLSPRRPGGELGVGGGDDEGRGAVSSVGPRGPRERYVDSTADEQL